MEAVERVNSYNYQHSDIFNYLNQKTGLNITNLSDIYIYWELLRLVEERGYELPKWATQVYPHDIANLHATVMTSLCASSPNMMNLLAGKVFV